MRTSESITNISKALLKAQKSMTGTVGKGSNNPFFKSKYADLNAVREACLPEFNDAGISVLQPTVVVDGKNYVETILIHESGEFMASLTEIKVGKQNDAQAEGSGISYARRYGLQSFANLAAVDDDGESSIGRGSKSNNPVNIAADMHIKNDPVKTVDTPPKKTGEQAKTDAVKTSSFAKKAVEKKVDIGIQAGHGDLDL